MSILMIIRNVFIVGLGLIVWSTAFASGDHGRSVEAVMQSILNVQGVSGEGQINCKEINEDMWEELGDAVMNEMVGDDQQHEAMDAMMGGDGSESLRAMHIRMGQQSLGCGDGTGTGLLHSGSLGQMGGMMGGSGGMMGSFSSGMGNWLGGRGSVLGNLFGGAGMMGLGGLGAVLFWTVFIVGAVLLVKWLANNRQNNESALDVLKKRYVKGEIDKDEFEIKKQDLT